jgi:type IV secretion system protein VirB10
MVSCTLTRNVYSDNGKVLLLERGSTVTGEFGGRIRTGQTRIYVLWNRIKTPKGVVVNLDSPGSDALGRSGVDGEVDKHWGERIGNAFLLSLIQDAIGYAATRGNNQNGSSQMYFQNTQQTGDNMANTILKDSLQIPPTITKKQGDRVAIFVARDLDFSTVYDLMPQVAVQQTNTPQP